MLKVYKTKKLVEEVGRAVPIKKGFEIALYNGSENFLLIKNETMIGSFAITSNDLAVYLGAAKEFYLDSYKIISFNTDIGGCPCYLHIDQDYFSVVELENLGGVAA